MTRDEIGIGVIGAGYFGDQHAKVAESLSGARVVAVSRRDTTRAKEFAARYKALPYEDYRSLLERPEVDAVVICTPHHTHATIAIEAAQAGKHILLEKPMALTLAECDSVLSAIEAAGTRLIVGYTFHFMKAYQVARSLIAEGLIGEPVFGSCDMVKLWMEPNRREWHLKRVSGGGMWLTAGIHCLDRLTWLIDDRIESVWARFATSFHDQEVDDLGLVSLSYQNGCVGTIRSIGYKTGVASHVTEIIGREGMLRIDHSSGVQVGKDDQWKHVPDSVDTDPASQALEREWESFLRLIREPSSQNPVSGLFARHITAAAQAAQDAARRGRELSVSD